MFFWNPSSVRQVADAVHTQIAADHPHQEQCTLPRPIICKRPLLCRCTPTKRAFPKQSWRHIPNDFGEVVLYTREGMEWPQGSATIVVKI